MILLLFVCEIICFIFIICSHERKEVQSVMSLFYMLYITFGILILSVTQRNTQVAFLELYEKVFSLNIIT